MAADDWIKMRVHLRDDPGVAAIQSATGLDLDAIVGKLHTFWSWADSHVTECQNGDGKAPSITPDWVDQKVGCQGFAEGLVRAGWARFTSQSIVLPRYTSNNGTTGKSRAQANRRQAKRRAGVTKVSRSERDKNDTRGEERREEKKRGKEGAAPPPSVLPPALPDSPPSLLGEPSHAQGDGMDGRRAALAEADIGGRWADALLASEVAESEIRAETKRAKSSRNVRNVAAVVANSLARRHGVVLPGKKLRLTQAESDLLDTVHRRRQA